MGGVAELYNICKEYCEKNKILQDDLQAQKKATDFYKNMAEHETESLTDRKSITDRLRSNGL